MPWLWRYKQDSRVPSKLKSRSWLWRYKTQEFHKNYNLDYGFGDTRLEFHKNYNLDHGHDLEFNSYGTLESCISKAMI
jgi:hypothetical protein